jgi:DnaJ-class molecular chaperone
MSLYETLDLSNNPPPDAATIKRAYKRKAKETHPDKGGTNEQFAKVSRAYLVLSDPVRRQKYDATGDIPEVSPVDAPLNLLVQFFVTIVSMYANGQGADPCTMDLIKVAREQFRKDILEAENHQVKIRRTIKLWQNVEKRFGSKKKVDVLKLLLAGQVPPLEAQLRLMDEQIALRKDALKLLDGYTFAFDAPALAAMGVWRFTS